LQEISGHAGRGGQGSPDGSGQVPGSVGYEDATFGGWWLLAGRFSGTTR
jgi:hypothetical protein